MRNKIFIFVCIALIITILNCVPEEKFTYIDKTGSLITKNTFEYAYPFSEGYAAILKNDKIGFINANGEIAIPLQFEYAASFQEGFAVIGQNKLFGYINKSGNICIQPEYNEVTPFINGLAAVVKDKKVGFIDTTGRVRIDFLYDKPSYLSEGLINIRLKYKWGYINIDGETIIDFIFDEAFPFHEERAFIKIGKKYGVIDKTGEIIVKPILNPVNYNILPNLNIFFKNSIHFITDHKYNPPVSIEAGNMGRFKDGYAPVSINGKMGMIDKDGNFLVEPIYDYVSHFNEDIVLVSEKPGDMQFFSYIDKKGNIVFKAPSNWQCFDFYNGVARFQDRTLNKIGYINKEGKIIIESSYDLASNFNDDIAYVGKNKKFGFIDKNNIIILDIKYDFVRAFSEGFAVIKLE